MISAGKGSHPRIIMPIISLKTCKQCSFRSISVKSMDGFIYLFIYLTYLFIYHFYLFIYYLVGLGGVRWGGVGGLPESQIKTLDRVPFPPQP